MNIVLIPGWGFQSNIWQPFIPYLKKAILSTSARKQFRVITIDLPGFGKSKLPKEKITLELMTQQILKSIVEPSVIIGWSLGGLVAMNIALYQPKLVTHLITFASTPKFVATDEWPGMSPQTFQQFYQSLKMDHQATLQQFILLQFYGSDTSRSVIKSVKRLVSDSILPIERVLTESLDILNETDLRKQLTKIKCPQQYIYGDCDILVPVKVAEKIKPYVNKAQIEVLPKTSHAPFLSKPKLCAQHIGMFLK